MYVFFLNILLNFLEKLRPEVRWAELGSQPSSHSEVWLWCQERRAASALCPLPAGWLWSSCLTSFEMWFLHLGQDPYENSMSNFCVRFHGASYLKRMDFDGVPCSPRGLEAGLRVSQTPGHLWAGPLLWGVTMSVSLLSCLTSPCCWMWGTVVSLGCLWALHYTLCVVPGTPMRPVSVEPRCWHDTIWLMLQLLFFKLQFDLWGTSLQQ